LRATSTRGRSGSCPTRSGGRHVAKGHTLLRGADNPNQVFVRLEFDTIEDAKAFAEKVRGSNVLEGLTLTVPPTAVELLDKAEY
jgi:hypothetical protein